MGQDELFFQANEFLENISGRDHLGIAKANLVIRIGGGESSHAITADLGPVVLEKRNMQECYMLTFQFEKQGALRQCYEQVEKYASCSYVSMFIRYIILFIVCINFITHRFWVINISDHTCSINIVIAAP